MEDIMKTCIGILIILMLLFTNQVYAVKVAELPDLNRPDTMRIDKDDLFVVDLKAYHIWVYSLSTGQLKMKIGKQGQGPGEFAHFPRLDAVLPDSIYCSSANKNLVFSRDGRLISEKTFPPPTGFNLMPVKENFIATEFETSWETRRTIKSLVLMNSKYEKIKTIYKVLSDSNFITPNDTGEEEFRLLYNIFEYIVYKDNIFTVDSKKGFFIDVIDANGNPLYSIDIKVEPLKVTESQKKKMLDHLYAYYQDITRLKKKSAFTFYENFPAIRQVCIDSDKIYVTTYREKDGNNEMIVLDLKGNILKTLYLPIKATKEWKMLGEYDTFTIHKDVLYELIESAETGDWVLYKTDLSTIK